MDGVDLYIDIGLVKRVCKKKIYFYIKMYDDG